MSRGIGMRREGRESSRQDVLQGEEPLGALLLWAGQGRAGAVPAEAAANNGKALPRANIPCLHGTLQHGGHILCLHGHALSPGILRPARAPVKGAAAQSKHARNEEMKWQP